MLEQGWYLTAGLDSTVQRKPARGPLPHSPRLSSSPDLTPTPNLSRRLLRRLGSPSQPKTPGPPPSRHLVFSRFSRCQEAVKGTDLDPDRRPLGDARRPTGQLLALGAPVMTSPLPWKLEMKKMSGKGKKSWQIWPLRHTSTGSRHRQAQLGTKCPS